MTENTGQGDTRIALTGLLTTLKTKVPQLPLLTAVSTQTALYLDAPLSSGDAPSLHAYLPYFFDLSDVKMKP